jgi:hypothetical protein
VKWKKYRTLYVHVMAPFGVFVKTLSRKNIKKVKESRQNAPNTVGSNVQKNTKISAGTL